MTTTIEAMPVQRQEGLDIVQTGIDQLCDSLKVKTFSANGSESHSVYEISTASGSKINILPFSAYSPPLVDQIEVPINEDNLLDTTSTTHTRASSELSERNYIEGKAVFVKKSDQLTDSVPGQIFVEETVKFNDGTGLKESSDTSIAKNTIGTGDSLILVERKPIQLLEVASMLVNDPKVGEALKAAKSGKTDELFDYVMDGLAAITFFSPDGYDRTNYEKAFITVLSAVSGNEGARELVQSRINQMNEFDLEKARSMKQDVTDQADHARSQGKEVDRVPLENMVAVHITDRLPRHGRIETVHKTTGRGRNTVHFAINHPVASHQNGSWDDHRIAVVAPLKSLIDLNGNPESMLPVDTYFETSANHDVVLPEDAVLIRPGLLSSGEIIDTTNDRDIRYKREGFTDDDWAKFQQLKQVPEWEVTSSPTPEQAEMLAQDIRDLAIELQIIKFGGALETAGGHGWSDWNIGAVGAAALAGVGMPTHYYTPHHETSTRKIAIIAKEMRDGNIPASKGFSQIDEWIKEYFDALTADTRRLLIERGLI